MSGVLLRGSSPRRCPCLRDAASIGSARSRQEPKCYPPTGPGGRRPPPDSAMRPRAPQVFGTGARGDANRVMPGLDPGIHLLAKRMDCRVEPGNDEAGTWHEMFDSLSERLGGILDRLTRRGALTEADVDAALREVRRALLEADVALDVVRAFVDKVKSHAVGVEVIKSVTPGQMVVKIVHDQLIDTLGTRGEPVDLNAPAPVPIMMVGLQGWGKTTTTAKLAKRLVEQARRKVLMASLDVRRPAAMEQLAVLGQQVNVDTLPIVAGQQPAQIAQRALQAGRLGGYDAVNLARAFNDRVGLTGIVLTRVDGDGRGGAALSMRAVTGKPIKLLGTGEKMDALEDFYPARIASRILGMGDIVSLVEKAAANIDAEKAARTAEKMRKGQFDLADMREQLLQMATMGGISGLMGMMPGIAKMKNQIAAAGLDDKIIKRQVAIIDSMTRQERKNPDILKASRKRRIAAGAGQTVEHVNKLLKMHRNMADVMKAMGSGKRGPLAGIAQAMGFGGGMPAPSPEQLKALAEKMPGGLPAGGMPSLPKDLPPGLRSGLPSLPGLTGLSNKPNLPGLGGP